MQVQEQRVFKALNDTVSKDNIYTEKDPFGNSLITFTIADDVAITFAVDSEQQVKGVWYIE